MAGTENWGALAFAALIVGGLVALSVQSEEGLSWPASLDFTGGVRLEYQINPEDATRKGLYTADDKRQVLQRVQEVFVLRLRGFDLSEIVLKGLGTDRLSVEVPGTKAIDDVKEAIGKPSVLSFRLLAGPPISAREVQDIPAEDSDRYFRMKGTNRYYPVSEPLLDATDIFYSGVEVLTFPPPKSEPYIRLALKAESQAKMAAISNKYFGEPLAICLDQVVETAPRIAARNIQEPILTGYQRSHAKDLAKILRSGPLPVSLDLTSEVLVSPNLGPATLERATHVLTVAAALVLLLVVLAYADHLSLIVTFFTCLVIEAILLFLAGYAGFLTLNLISLSGIVVLLGISVDNLILIFEEFRYISGEEIGFSKRSWFSQLATAFDKESNIIFYANLTTLMVLVPLYPLEESISDLIKVMGLGIILAFVINIYYASRLLASGSPIFRLEEYPLLNRAPLNFRRSLYPLARPVLAAYAVAVVLAGSTVWQKQVEWGLDFQEGTEIRFATDVGVDLGLLQGSADEYFGEHCQVKMTRSSLVAPSGDFHYLVRTRNREVLRSDDAPQGIPAGRTAESFASHLESRLSAPVRLESIDLLGPTVVSLNRKTVMVSLIAAFVVLLFIVGWKYSLSFAIPVVVALAFDGLVTLGAVSFAEIQVSIPIAAALLTVVGYSINDSLVLAGHIHRKLERLVSSLDSRSLEQLGELEEDPRLGTRELMTETLKELSGRIILTSLTTVGVASVLWILGEGLLHDFGLVITVGTAVGTCSSLSLVVLWLEGVLQPPVARAVGQAKNRLLAARRHPVGWSE